MNESLGLLHLRECHFQRLGDDLKFVCAERRQVVTNDVASKRVCLSQAFKLQQQAVLQIGRPNTNGVEVLNNKQKILQVRFRKGDALR